MTREDELNELRERLGKLRFDDQLHLFELLLGDHRRKCDEARAELAAQMRALRDDPALARAVSAPFRFPPEAKREAG